MDITPEMLANARQAQRTKNAAESKFLREYKGIYREFYRSGWPDFLVYTDDREWQGIEIKPEAGMRDPVISQNQALVMNVLTLHGLPCKVWTPGYTFPRDIKPMASEPLSPSFNKYGKRDEYDDWIRSRPL